MADDTTTAQESTTTESTKPEAPAQNERYEPLGVALVDAPSLEQVDSSLRALMAQADGNEPNAESAEAATEKSGRARDENGRFVKKETTPEAQAQAGDTNTEAESESSAETSQEEGAKAEDIRKAMEALKLDGFSKKRLDAWLKDDPDDFVQTGLKRAKNQADVNRTYAEQKAEVERLKKAAPAAETTTPEAKAESAVDVDALAKPLADYMAEQLGDAKASEPVRQLVKGLIDNVSGAFKQQFDAQAQQIAQANAASLEVMSEQARSELLSDYPELKNRDTYLKVRKRMQQIYDPAEHADMRALMDVAAQIETGPERFKRAKEAQAELNRKRDDGVPTADMRATEPKEAMTLDDLRTAALRAKSAGKEDEYQRLTAQARKLAEAT